MAISIAGIGAPAEAPVVRGRLVRSKWARNLLTFLMGNGTGLLERGNAERVDLSVPRRAGRARFQRSNHAIL